MKDPKLLISTSNLTRGKYFRIIKLRCDLILCFLVAIFFRWYSFVVCRPVVPRCAGCAMAHPDFGRSVNPISTRDHRLCPPNYYWHTEIFRPSDGPFWSPQIVLPTTNVPYSYGVNGKLVMGNGFLTPICSLSNRSLLPSLTL